MSQRRTFYSNGQNRLQELEMAAEAETMNAEKQLALYQVLFVFVFVSVLIFIVLHKEEKLEEKGRDRVQNNLRSMKNGLAIGH